MRIARTQLIAIVCVRMPGIYYAGDHDDAIRARHGSRAYMYNVGHCVLNARLRFMPHEIMVNERE